MKLIIVFACPDTSQWIALLLLGGREALARFNPVRIKTLCHACGRQHVFPTIEGQLAEWDGESLRKADQVA